jgi:hypothetical protein
MEMQLVTELATFSKVLAGMLQTAQFVLAHFLPNQRMLGSPLLVLKNQQLLQQT